MNKTKLDPAGARRALKRLAMLYIHEQKLRQGGTLNLEFRTLALDYSNWLMNRTNDGTAEAVMGKTGRK